MPRPRRGRDEPGKFQRQIKRLIWELRVREHECCGQKIAYFLEREHQVRLSVPKIYEILAEKYVIRSKWHKNQKRGAVPTATLRLGPSSKWIPWRLASVFAFTGSRYLHQRGGGDAPPGPDQ